MHLGSSSLVRRLTRLTGDAQWPVSLKLLTTPGQKGAFSEIALRQKMQNMVNLLAVSLLHSGEVQRYANTPNCVWKCAIQPSQKPIIFLSLVSMTKKSSVHLSGFPRLRAYLN